MYDRGVFIPACDEQELLPGALNSLAQLPYKTLLALVINHRKNASVEIKKNNKQTLNWLFQFPHTQISPNRYKVRFPSLDILLIDHQSNGFELAQKQGVGLARHIGATALVDTWKKGEIEYPIFWSTDADARFSEDYLNPFQAQAGVYPLPYKHIEASDALKLYEISLRYYTLALQWAGSPYAYPTIGSSIAFHGDTYLTTRGFPDRMAGEDFYWLNKARKVSNFAYPNKSPVMLIDRPSDRVPFGTGKGSADIAAANNSLRLYDPIIFYHLKKWLVVMNTAEDKSLIPQLKAIFPEYDGYNRLSKVISQPTAKSRQRQRRHEFFDAFRTMRWVHQFRDTHHPSIEWMMAIKTADWIPFAHENLNQVTEAMLTLEQDVLKKMSYPRSLSADHSS